MERFCDELRWERERRKVSIEKISQETKVASRHLQALEAGEYASLPGGVFRKGIVRSYLAALGLDEVSLLNDLRPACARVALRIPMPGTGPSLLKMCGETGLARNPRRICDGWAWG